MHTRISVINYKKNVQADAQPSRLYSLFAHRSNRDILSVLACYLTTEDMDQVKLSSKSAHNNINDWLAKMLVNPVELLRVVSALDKIQIARLLQKYFYQGSPYLASLEQRIFAENTPQAYACYALVTPIARLDTAKVAATLDWLREQGKPGHVIQSLTVIYNFLNIDEEQDVKDIISANPLAYINLQGANLEHEDLSDVDLSSANLQWVQLSNAFMGNANLQGALFRGANLSHAIGSEINFKFANLQFANMQHSVFMKSDFTHADLRFADLGESHMNNSIFNGARLQGANLEAAKLNEIDAIGANFCRANLTLANLQCGDLGEANLEGAQLAFSSLFSANLRKTSLSHSKRRLTFAGIADLAQSTNNNESAVKARRL